MSDYSPRYSGIAVDAVRANGRVFNDTDRMVYELPLQGLSFSVPSGTQTSVIRMASVTNKEVVRQIAAQKGASTDPIALGLMFKISCNVTVAAGAGTTTPDLRATHSFVERHALSTIQVSPGKAGEAYLMSNGETSMGQLTEWLQTSSGFRQQFAAAFEACDDFHVTADRNATNSDGHVISSLDNVHVTGARSLMNNEQRRLCYLGNGATPVTLPEPGTPINDLFFFPLTMDGPTGVSSAGFSVESLFSSENEWNFYVRPVFDAAQYSPGSALIGNYTITVSLIYRLHEGKRYENDIAAAPAYGAVWKWIRQCGTIPDGVSTVINGSNVVSHIAVGYPALVYGDPTTGSPLPVQDGSFYFKQEVQAGTGEFVVRRLIPPALRPADLNTAGTYLELGREGGGISFSLGGWTQAKGNETVKALNWRQRNKAIKDALALPMEGIEYPLFSDAGAVSLPYTFATYRGSDITPGGAGILELVYTDGSATNIVPTAPVSHGSTVTDLGLGGMRNFLLAWCDRTVDGFCGTEVRSDTDAAGLRVLTVGGFQLPKRIYSNQSAYAQVQVLTRMGPYEGFSANPCDCHPDHAEPLVFKANSPTADKGDALTSAFKVTRPVLDAGMTYTSGTISAQKK